MAFFIKPIFTGFVPELTGTDVWLAVRHLLPWRWPALIRGNNPASVEEWLKKYLRVPFVRTVDSGRSALFIALKSLGVGAGDEVLVQAFTCLVVVNAIRFVGAIPVFVDIGANFNINVADLQKKITRRSKVIIIQHTFGLSADVLAILSLAKRSGIKTIEDCAHALGTRYSGQLLGTLGDIGMYSFGTDKVISSIRGGAISTKDAAMDARMDDLCQSLPVNRPIRVIKHLLVYPVFAIGRLLYFYGIGKLWLAMAKRINLYSRIITDREKLGKTEPGYPSKFPNALAGLLLAKLPALDGMNQKRLTIARYYDAHIINSLIRKPVIGQGSGSICLRYTILVNQPQRLIREAKRKHIMLGDWYDTPIAPKDSSQDAMGYKIGECPAAELAACQSVNLPTVTSLTSHDLDRIIGLVNAYRE